MENENVTQDTNVDMNQNMNTSMNQDMNTNMNQNTYQAPMANGENIPEKYKPISMWGYFGYEILFSIPCIGIILLCVFAFGGTQNINLRNFARSYFCFFIIAIVLVVLLSVVFGSYFTMANYSTY